MPDTNLPPADELHAVRAQLKTLESRERELRSLMLTDPSARTGTSYCVEIRDAKTSRTDIVEMRKNYPEIVEQFTYPVTTQQVVLYAITEDGEIVNIRRTKPKETPNGQ